MRRDDYHRLIARQQPRIVVLTNGSSQAIRVLEGLVARGIVADAVVVESPSPWLTLRRAWSSGSAGAAFIELASAARRAVRLLRTRKRLPHLARAVVRTGALNGERMRGDIAALDPDILVLGGIGIVSAAILGTARIAVLNAHPALLPWVRGTGVVGRSLERGVAVGSTVHYVEQRVDAGRVIDRRLVEVRERSPLAELQARADELGVEMLVDVVADIVAGGSVPAAVPQEETFPASRRLSWRERRALDRMARAGLAHELFMSWSVYSVDGEHYRLPAGFGVGRFGVDRRPETATGNQRRQTVRRTRILGASGVLVAAAGASACVFADLCIGPLCC